MFFKVLPSLIITTNVETPGSLAEFRFLNVIFLVCGRTRTRSSLQNGGPRVVRPGVSSVNLHKIADVSR